MAEQLAAFNSASQRTEDQKQALLQAVAQAGSAGARAYDQAQTQTTGLRDQAVGAALGAASTSPLSGISGGTERVTGPINQNFAMRQADLAQGNATFQQDIARQGASGEQFFGQMQSAIPVVENYTRQAVEKILSAERESQADRQLQREIAQNQLAQSRQSSSGNDLRDQIAQSNEQRTAFCFENPDDPKCLSASERKQVGTEASAAQAKAATDALNRIAEAEDPKVFSIVNSAFFDENGDPRQSPVGYLKTLIGSTLETAADADKGGRGKTHRRGALNYEYILDLIKQVQNAGGPAGAGSEGQHA